MKNTKILYIIGNGFDLHHKISSSYFHFKQYVHRKDKSLYSLIDEYLQTKDDWSDFEVALASIDIEYLMDYAGMFLKSYGADDWRDSAHHDYQFEIEQIVTQLSASLKQHFIDWLQHLNIPTKKSLKLKKKAQYLTFNYTNTLQSTYKIPNQDILHIHGSLKQPQNIMLGHGWKPKNNRYVEEPFEPSEVDVRVSEGNTIIEEYFLQTFKPTEKIIKKNREFFKRLHRIDNIYVLGHSISDVDIAYFQVIAKNVNLRKTQWIVSYHDKKDKARHLQQLQKVGVEKSNIKLIKLTKLKRKKSR